MKIDLRAATLDDRTFLYSLYCRTMRGVVEKTWGWEEAWERVDFDCRFRVCSSWVIECDDHMMGGLLLESEPDSIYIYEVQVLPEYQGRGIGTEVLRRLIDQAESRGVAVTLSVVEANSRAKQLYERLGFYVTKFNPPFFRMRYATQLGAGIDPQPDRFDLRGHSARSR